MKTLFLASAFVLVSFGILCAQDMQVSTSIAQALQRNFAGASQIRWEKTGPLYLAQFQYNNGFWLAYFDDQGTLAASGRKIDSIEQLPVAVKRGFTQLQQKQERKYGSFEVGAPYELVIENGTTQYFLPIENSHVAIMAISDASGNAQVRTKTERTGHTKPAADMVASTIRH
ncbi:hypothetical protein SAMN04488109_2633 [Chryseolinea serpens]|uniref:Beta-lactamase-inhibitor-like, PepSY-like n=1 Tax=Chryseolinea serpens TaxID=947013 RepID=A0A1M5P1V3_9BACT|nr:hypothetical protein [Chryseolinea serpens]SHG95781.1 hypothetical protein SAMN04488109_2633 [Chryseolinea serpens]